MPDPSGAEAERLLAAPKEIGGDIVWKQVTGGRIPRWRFEVSVVVPATADLLRLVGNYGRTNWGFSLLYRNVPIRRFDGAGAPHTNPDGTKVSQPHKHRWHDLHDDRQAYVPDDIDVSNVNVAIFDFLKECGIDFKGRYQPLMLT